MVDMNMLEEVANHTVEKRAATVEVDIFPRPGEGSRKRERERERERE